MERLTLETVTHRQEGHDITYVLRAGRDDWFCNILRQRPHGNPAWYHLHRRRLTEGRLLSYADFGANIGVTALLPARIGHRVLAVEAGPENIALLTEARRRNHLQSQLTIAHWAASDSFGMASFHEASAWGSTRPSPTRAGQTTLSRVPTAPAADILEMQAMDGVDLLKMDIEGSELAALTGFERITARNPSLEMIVETNWETCQLHDHTPQDVWARLGALGFSCHLLDGRKLTPVQPNLPQPRFVCDVLATRRSPSDLETLGYEISALDVAQLPTQLAATPISDRPPESVAAFIEAQTARLA